MRIFLLLLIGSLALAQNLDEIFERVAKYEYGASREALVVVENTLRDSSRYRELEQRLLALLASSSSTLPAKDFACRQLSLIGTNASVPALVKLLGSTDTAAMARYALERINTPEARKALLAVPQPKSTGRADTETATLKRAERFMAASDRPSAARLYRQLYVPVASESTRVAALRGLAAAAPAQAMPLVRQALAKGTPRMQAAAIQVLGSMKGNAATELLVGETAKLPVAAQIQALAALAARGDTAARPALVRAVKSDQPAVRLAALEGLGALGDTSTVPLLAEAAADSTGEEQAAARASLSLLRGPGIDVAVLAGIEKSSDKLKAEFVRAAGERAIPTAVQPLLTAAKDSSGDVRREAVRALRDTANASHLAALVQVLGAARGSTERREAERTVVAVLRRSENPAGGPLVAAFRAASQPEERASLLTVMASAGLADTLPLFREALGSSDDAQRRAAITALAEWPNAAPASELLGVAQGDRSPALRVLAVRGYLKLLSLPSSRKPGETATMLASALKAAGQADEKRATLAALQRAASPEALAAAESALNDPEVGAEAKLAVQAIRRVLAQRK